MEPPGRALMVLTDRHQVDGRGLVATVVAAVAGGGRMVVLREKDLSPSEREELGRRLVGVLAPVGGSLIVAGPDVALARRLGAAGVHLAAADPFPHDRTGLAVGRSCHDGTGVVAAAAEGVDYVTLSPVFSSASKPGYGPALGLGRLAEVARAVPLAVVALGGIGAREAGACLAAGAAGVAVMGAVMAADDPAAATRALLGRLAAVGPDRAHHPHPLVLAPQVVAGGATYGARTRGEGQATGMRR
ncbi:MAG TPA: thiamine phosphate synthase [Acidimicrobiales bacterium]|nr:thiamine phosphate synthase [Acidimicrobiales bacterium]